MHTKQTIAIIGATGKTGLAISQRLVNGHYRLLLVTHRPEAAQDLCALLGTQCPQADIEVMDCPTAACWEADMILLATPHGAEPEMTLKIQPMVNQKTVICLAQPAKEDFLQATDTFERGQRVGAALQQHLPYAKVTMAIFNQHPDGRPSKKTPQSPLQCQILGDDPESVTQTAALIATCGFKAAIKGPLTLKYHLEPNES